MSSFTLDPAKYLALQKYRAWRAANGMDASIGTFEQYTMFRREEESIQRLTDQLQAARAQLSTKLRDAIASTNSALTVDWNAIIADIGGKPAPLPAPEPTPVTEPAPVPAPAPEPTPEPAPVPAPVAPVLDSAIQNRDGSVTLTWQPVDGCAYVAYCNGIATPGGDIASPYTYTLAALANQGVLGTVCDFQVKAVDVVTHTESLPSNTVQVVVRNVLDTNFDAMSIFYSIDRPVATDPSTWKYAQSADGSLLNRGLLVSVLADSNQANTVYSAANGLTYTHVPVPNSSADKVNYYIWDHDTRGFRDNIRATVHSVDVASAPTTAQPLVRRQGIAMRDLVSVRVNFLLEKQANVAYTTQPYIFFQIYTVPTGSGDKATWYKSRFTVNKPTLLGVQSSQMILDADVSLPLSLSDTSNYSAVNSTSMSPYTTGADEEVMAVSVQTDSGAAQPFKFVLRSAALQLASGETRTVNFKHLV